MVEDYLVKQNQDIRDEDGFPIEYEVEQSWEDYKMLTKTDTMAYLPQRGTETKRFLTISIAKSKFTLIKNNEIVKEITLIAQVYVDNIQYNGLMWIPHEEYYFPELDDKSTRDEIIKKLTSVEFMGGDEQLDKNLRTTYSKTIKESGVFKYEHLSDFES